MVSAAVSLVATTLTGCAWIFPEEANKPKIAEVDNSADIDADSQAAIDASELLVNIDKDDIVEIEDTSADELSTDAEEVTEVANVWDVAKNSGEEVDFKKYFNIDASIYKPVIRDGGTVERVSYYSSYIDHDNEAYIYTPPEYDTDMEYPAVYVFHGLGCDGEQWISMGATRMLDNLINTRKIEPVIAVFPSIVPKNGLTEEWLSDENIGAFDTFTQVFSKSLRPYVNEYYSVSTDRDKTAVCGLSMGGMEALKIGFNNIEEFDYIGSFSAAPTLDTDILKVSEGIDAPKLVLLCTGDADDVVGENPQTYHETLAENGVDHIWYLHTGGKHTPNVWDVAFINFITRAFGVEDSEDIAE